MDSNKEITLEVNVPTKGTITVGDLFRRLRDEIKEGVGLSVNMKYLPDSHTVIRVYEWASPEDVKCSTLQLEVMESLHVLETFILKKPDKVQGVLSSGD